MKLLAYNIQDVRAKDGQALSDILQTLGVHVTQAQETQAIDFASYDATLFYGANQQALHPYVVALSLAQQKPVIYLTPKLSSIPAPIKLLQADAKLSKLIHLKEVHAPSLVQDVSDALNAIEKGALKEIPSIKFTLRITPTIERYLQWKSQESGLSKADVLREYIEKDLIDQDKNFPRS